MAPGPWPAQPPCMVVARVISAGVPGDRRQQPVQRLPTQMAAELSWGRRASRGIDTTHRMQERTFALVPNYQC